MIPPRNPKLNGTVKALRNNMTKHEKHLWYDFLKKLPITVKRQKNIGNYIVDFYIAKAQLVIELDGLQHTSPEHEANDLERDAYLQSIGLTVLRYTNENIDNNFNNVCEDILCHIPDIEYLQTH